MELKAAYCNGRQARIKRNIVYLVTGIPGPFVMRSIRELAMVYFVGLAQHAQRELPRSAGRQK